MPGRGLRIGARARYRGGRHSGVSRRQYPFRLNMTGLNIPDIQVGRQIFPETTVKKPARSLAVIDESVCITCGKCVGACPFNAISITDKPNVDTSMCKCCGRCVPVCPVGAISMRGA
jgi:Pyruvate/2-oxoacid:ferredoxin oxidoreductase delta subunit